MIASGEFNPATMNPASIILPTIEHLTNSDSNSISIIDIIIIIIFILLVVLIYLRISHKI